MSTQPTTANPTDFTRKTLYKCGKIGTYRTTKGTLPMQMYTIPEVTKILKVERSTVYKLMNSEQLPSVKIGGARRIPHDGLQEYVSRLRTA